MTTAPVIHGHFYQPPPGSEEWGAVTPDTPDTPFSYKFTHRDGSGRSIAFEGLPASGRGLVSACVRAARGGAQVVNVATGPAPAALAPPAPEESGPRAFVNG
ncbi:MAG TPA: hypothetical protein VF611_20510 [Pyrinomonadaceae bacterium]|jgi:hypothetical protein